MPVFSKSFSSTLPDGYEKPSTYTPVHKQNSDHEEPEGIDRFVSGLTDAKQWAFVGGLHVLGNVFGSKGARFFAKHKLSASLGHVMFDEVGTGVLTASLRGPEGLLIHIVRDVLEGLATRGVLIGGARFIPGLKAFRILLQPLLLGVNSYVFQGIGDRLVNEKTQQKFSNHLWDMAAVFVQGGMMGKAPMLFHKGKQLYQQATPQQRKLAGFTASMAVGVASGAISVSEALMASGLAVGVVKVPEKNELAEYDKELEKIGAPVKKGAIGGESFRLAGSGYDIRGLPRYQRGLLTLKVCLTPDKAADFKVWADACSDWSVRPITIKARLAGKNDSIHKALQAEVSDSIEWIVHNIDQNKLKHNAMFRRPFVWQRPDGQDIPGSIFLVKEGSFNYHVVLQFNLTEYRVGRDEQVQIFYPDPDKVNAVDEVWSARLQALLNSPGEFSVWPRLQEGTDRRVQSEKVLDVASKEDGELASLEPSVSLSPIRPLHWESWSGQIRKAREEKGLTIEQLSEHLDISANTLKTIERWHLPYCQTRLQFSDTEMVRRLAGFLNLSFDYFAYGINRQLYPHVPADLTRGLNDEMLLNSVLAVPVFEALALRVKQGDAADVVRQDVRYKVLSKLWDIYGRWPQQRDKLGSQQVLGLTIFNFLKFQKRPDSRTKQYLMEELGLTQHELELFIVDHDFKTAASPRPLLKKAGLPSDVAIDLTSTYDHSRTRLYQKDSKGVGLLLWSRRKLKRQTIRDAAEQFHIPSQVYHEMERNIKADEKGRYHRGAVPYSIDWPLMARVFWGMNHGLEKAHQVKWCQFKKAVLKTYPHLREADDFKFYDTDYEPTRTMAMRAIMPLSHEEVVALVRETTGSTRFGVNQAHYSTHLPTPHVSAARVADFMVTFANKIARPDRFWAGAHPYLKEIFPDLNPARPRLTVPAGFNLASIWKTSLPKALAHRRLVEEASLSVLRDELGLQTNSLVLSYEGADFGLQQLERLKHFADVVGLDRRALFLARHPWALLALPVYDDAGQKVTTFNKYKDKKQKQLLQFKADIDRYLAQASNGCALVRNYLKEHQLKDTEKLKALGIPEALAKKIQRSSAYILKDDELVTLAHCLSGIDTTKLVEGFRKGPLALAFEMTDDGALDWSKPTGFWHDELEFLSRMPGVEYQEAA